MLFLSDLDFTLLRDDTTLSKFTKEIWNRVSYKTKLSIATARSYTGVKELLKGLRLSEPLILLDGAVIANPDGSILHIASIDKELGNAIIDLAKKEFQLEPLIVAYQEGRESFHYPKNLNRFQKELIQTMKMRNRIFSDHKLQAQEQNLKIVYQLESALSFEFEEKLTKAFGDSIEIKNSKDPYFNCHFITILHPLGDKGHALLKLEEIENIAKEKTTVFGDSYNDIGIFEAAGKKVAVANAVDALKQRADIVLKESNNEDAVAKYLQKEILENTLK